MPNFFVLRPTLSFATTTSAVSALVVQVVAAAAAAAAGEDTDSEICEDNSDSSSSECTTSRSHACIDGRCMCNPMWAHTGADCSERTWTSWAVAVVLVLVTLYSIHVLHAAAKRGLSSSTKPWAGFAELASIFFMVKRENGDKDLHTHALG